VGQFPGEPGPGKVPVAADGARRNLENLDNFFLLQTAEIPQLHDLGLARSHFRERGERVVQGDDRTMPFRRHDGHFIQIHVGRAAASFVRGARAGGVHQDAPHHLRRDSEKLRTLPPLDFGDIDQSQIDFVDQSGGLQRVLPPLAFHVAVSHTAQFIVNLLRQLIERAWIARRPGFQQIGDFRVQEKSMTPMAAFAARFRLFRRQEIILPGGNMKSMLTASVALMASFAIAQSKSPTYSVLDLGPVGGAPGQPYFITNNELIAGGAVTANNQSHAAVWFMGFNLDLATPGLGGLNSFAYAVNEKGQVVGGAETSYANGDDFCGFNAYGVAKSSNTCLPFVFQNGVMTKLPTLGGPNGLAYAINNRSEAVGWAETTGRDPNGACGVLQFQPVLWGKTGVTPLQTFQGDPDGVAASINDNGQIVGATGSCQGFNVDSGIYLLEKHAMLWEGGVAINLGNLGGSGELAGHHACAINNRGQVVGHSDLTGDSTFHSFLWTWETGMQDIGTLPGDFASVAVSINDGGVAVGTSLDTSFNSRAFVWASGSMTDLNAVLTSNPQKLYLLAGNSINAGGEIVGLAANSNGDLHGFLAIPDSAENVLPAIESMSRMALSEEARKTIFRRIGIRGK